MRNVLLSVYFVYLFNTDMPMRGAGSSTGYSFPAR
jgi:hypothetical protein